MNFNFTSQICTTKEQSERLLTLGLKKETADMYYSHDKGEDIYAIRACWEDFWSSKKLIDGYIRRSCIPAWSLHRLIEMYTEHYVCEHINLKSLTYDTIIENIRLDILTGTFNKEYLE